MFNKALFTITLTLSLLTATTFKDITPNPTDKMLENQRNAKLCSSPVVANEEIREDFKYGCFCGSNYPNIDKNSTKDFRKLTYEQRIKTIESYYKIKPYDDIDTVCQQHDICYLYQGKKAKICNNLIYDDLHLLVDSFKEKNDKIENKQCQYLSYDIASVFKTIFTPVDDEVGMFDFGMRMFTTTITVANKTFEESVDTIIEQGPRYPKENHKCLKPKLQ